MGQTDIAPCNNDRENLVVAFVIVLDKLTKPGVLLNFWHQFLEQCNIALHKQRQDGKHDMGLALTISTNEHTSSVSRSGVCTEKDALQQIQRRLGRYKIFELVITAQVVPNIH